MSRLYQLQMTATSLSAQAHDRDGDDFEVGVINQGCFSCLSATCSPLLSPIKGCLHLNNKALISVNYYSSGHCILSVSLFCFYSILLSSFSPSYPHPDPSLSSVLALTSPCPVPSHWRESIDVCLRQNLTNWNLFLLFLLFNIYRWVHTANIINCVTIELLRSHID